MVGRGYDTSFVRLEYGGSLTLTGRWMLVNGNYNDSATAGQSSQYIVWQPVMMKGRLSSVWIASSAGSTDSTFIIHRRTSADVDSELTTFALSYSGAGREFIDLSSENIEVEADDQISIELDSGTVTNSTRAVLLIED